MDPHSVNGGIFENYGWKWYYKATLEARELFQLLSCSFICVSAFIDDQFDVLDIIETVVKISSNNRSRNRFCQLIGRFILFFFDLGFILMDDEWSRILIVMNFFYNSLDLLKFFPRLLFQNQKINFLMIKMNFSKLILKIH